MGVNNVPFAKLLNQSCYFIRGQKGMDTLVNVKTVCDRSTKKTQIKSYGEIAFEFGCSDEKIARIAKSGLAKAKRILERHGYKVEDFFGHEYYINLESKYEDKN